MQPAHTLNLVIVGVAILIGATLAFTISSNMSGGTGITSEAMAGENEPARDLAEPVFDTKTTGGMGSGDTLVELTPTITDGKRLVVKFKMNTHSVSLNRIDLKEAATMEFNGKALKPLKASKVGGHHTSGVMVFDVGDIPQTFSIKLEGIPKIKERIYMWNQG
jgi:hypothetical protein